MVAALAEPFRETFVLREIEKLSYREIADVVGAPVGTVMSRLARARAMLRSAWLAEQEQAEMTCDEAEILLHALIDGELDASHAREVEAHIASLPGLRRRVARLSRDAQGYGRRPICATPRPPACAGASRRRCRSRARAEPRARVLRGFAMGSAVSAIAATGLVAVVLREDDSSGSSPRSSPRICARCRPDHLIDVVSTDQHTVKPWFNGKLDVSPPVIDLTAQGFTLIGGRLDYVEPAPSAPWSTSARAHVINLFVAQTSNRTQPREDRDHAGLQHPPLGRPRPELWAVSDLAKDELCRFQQPFRERDEGLGLSIDDHVCGG